MKLTEKQLDSLPMRSCWECNQAHEHLKKSTFWCFACGKIWHKGECEGILYYEEETK